MEVHKLGWPRALAKRILPVIGPALGGAPFQKTFSVIETCAAILQGKGAGTGWDAGAETRVAIPFMYPGATVFDVGANKGTWTRDLLAAFDAPLDLYLFEPQSACQEDLEDLSRKGCEIVSAAVGDHQGTIKFHFPEEKAGNASIYERHESYFEHQIFKSIEVPIISIDKFTSDRGIINIDYMKIDVEGHELAVLKGADGIISRGSVRAIAFEFGSANIYSGTFFKNFWDYLTKKGYTISRITPGGRLSVINSYYEDLEHFRGVSNYLATHSKDR